MNLMKKAVVFLFAMLLFAVPAQAEVVTQKVQLHDTVTAESFAEAYNAEAKDKVTFGEPRTAGDYVSRLAPIGEASAMIVNANGEGLLSNIMLMHKGAVQPQEKDAVMDILYNMMAALGFERSELNDYQTGLVYEQLCFDSREPMATRVFRPDINRIYTFYKSWKPNADVYMVLVEAVTESEP